MNVTVAKNAGFCFGVKRATDMIEQQIRTNENTVIYTVGKLIHNDIYNARLEKAGVRTVTEDDIETVAASASVESPVMLFVRAHGMTQKTDALLKESAANNKYFNYVDCTCPYVKKIHRIADENSQQLVAEDGSEKIFILIGSAEHPEVKSIVSYFRGRSFVYPDADSLERAAKSGELPFGDGFWAIVAAQTTQKLSEWKKSLEIIKKLFTKSNIFDTICSVTEKRQLEAAELASMCDFVTVIGGQDSSNTSKLYSICSAKCKNTVRIEKASELAGKFRQTARRQQLLQGPQLPATL